MGVVIQCSTEKIREGSAMQASLVISISLALWMDTFCGGSVLISKHYHIYYIDPISKSECGMTDMFNRQITKQ